MMDEREIRLRLIEAAARTPTPHPEGYVTGVRRAAEDWLRWVVANERADGKSTLGLPKK